MEAEVSSDEEPKSERSDPSGASSNSEEIQSPRVNPKGCEQSCYPYTSRKFEEKLKNLEEEHELLNSSLCALTTHFAQVQFRLRQAVAAPQTDRETLLKSLEEFAFRGIPDVGIVRDRIDEERLIETVWERRVQQQHLIEKLKSQIREVDHIFKSELSGILRAKELQNQKVIFNELKLWINFDLNEEEYCQFTPADIKQKIYMATEQLKKPMQMKEELVTQLKTQIADLERFVYYLQENNKRYTTCTCCTLHPSQKPSEAADSIGIVKRTVTLLHMVAILYFGCLPQRFSKKNFNHWGDLRAQLEIAIVNVLEAVQVTERNELLSQGEYNSDDESSSVVSNVQVTMAVRKQLAISIRDLMLHGARKEVSFHRRMPFIGCFKQKFKLRDTPIHVWDIILKYYHLNSGERFNSTPVRKLSQSFNLDIVGECNLSNRNTMLSEIGNIVSTHSVYKCSYDSLFKAFICAALNANKLVIWLRLIFKSSTVVEMYYHSWSYVTKTRFFDALQSLDALTNLKFDLPVDLAIRRFQNIEDMFI